MAKYVVGRVDELKPWRRKIVTVEGRAIGIFNVNGEFFAVRDRCPHQGGSLCSGQLWGAVQAPETGEFEYSTTAALLRCPLHAWEFDVRTGQSWFDQDKLGRRRFPVTHETVTAELQKGPYVVETYPVTVEDQDLVIEIKGLGDAGL